MNTSILLKILQACDLFNFKTIYENRLSIVSYKRKGIDMYFYKDDDGEKILYLTVGTPINPGHPTNYSSPFLKEKELAIIIQEVKEDYNSGLLERKEIPNEGTEIGIVIKEMLP